MATTYANPSGSVWGGRNVDVFYGDTVASLEACGNALGVTYWSYTLFDADGNWVSRGTARTRPGARFKANLDARSYHHNRKG